MDGAGSKARRRPRSVPCELAQYPVEGPLDGAAGNCEAPEIAAGVRAFSVGSHLAAGSGRPRAIVTDLPMAEWGTNHSEAIIARSRWPGTARVMAAPT